MRAGAGVARLDPATDATFPDAKAEDLPAAVLYQRLAPPRGLPRSDWQKPDRRRLAPRRSAKNTAGRFVAHAG
jgi:hypothetical protein